MSSFLIRIASLLICVARVLPSEAVSNVVTPSAIISGDNIPLVMSTDLPMLEYWEQWIAAGSSEIQAGHYHASSFDRTIYAWLFLRAMSRPDYCHVLPPSVVVHEVPSSESTAPSCVV